MYRQNMEQQQEQLFHKLGELPIVNDTCHQVLDIYERTKGHNFLFRTTFGLAEATARVIAGKTLPIITNHCQPQLQKVNNVACDTLDALEEKYPIITRPTDEVLREGKEKYDKTLGPYLNPVIRPAVAAVNVGVSAVNMSTSAASAVVNSGKQSVGAVAKLGTDTVSGIYTFGKNRVTKAVDYGLQTPYGEFLLGQLDASLSLSEKMLDSSLSMGNSVNQRAKMMEKRSKVTRLDRMNLLTQRLHHRLNKRARQDFKQYHAFTKETVGHLTKVFDVMSRLKNSSLTDAYQEALKELTTYIDSLLVKYSDEKQNPDLAARCYISFHIVTRRKSLRLAHILGSNVYQRLIPLVDRLEQMTGNVKQRFWGAVEFVRESIPSFLEKKSLDEISPEYLERTKELLPKIQEFLSVVMSRVTDTLDWFAVDLNLELDDMEIADVAVVNCNGAAIQPAD
ncbi:hypothetical protein C0Q70_19821 [Pomacea canaliculata]|uniref:Perilipin n=1 Tax=Pomacea canaliculata TaxID=400727 RepID=A0A2T7NDT4_POMCA|nr:hypothetical protein C0Q70_19821 [Pomacea canaliculata]